MSNSSFVSVTYGQMATSGPMSLFIPHVHPNIKEDSIKWVVETQTPLGTVDRIDIVKVENKRYNRVFIHFKEWNDTEFAYNFQKSVRNPNEESRILYDDPWYWIVLENTSIKAQSNIVENSDKFIHPVKSWNGMEQTFYQDDLIDEDYDRIEKYYHDQKYYEEKEKEVMDLTEEDYDRIDKYCQECDEQQEVMDQLLEDEQRIYEQNVFNDTYVVTGEWFRRFNEIADENQNLKQMMNYYGYGYCGY